MPFSCLMCRRCRPARESSRTPSRTAPLTRKLSAFVALSEAELAVLERLHLRRRSFVAGQDLVHQGQSGQAAYILAEGWVCSYKIQADGSRQIVDFQIPGDFFGLRSVLLRTSDHGFEPIEDIQAAEVLASDLPPSIRRNTALGGGDTLGGVTGRGRGRRASRRNRTARCGRPHGTFSTRVGLEAGVGRDRDLGRVSLSADAVPLCRRTGSERRPREPRPAAASRSRPPDIPGGPSDLGRP